MLRQLTYVCLISWICFFGSHPLLAQKVAGQWSHWDFASANPWQAITGSNSKITFGKAQPGTEGEGTVGKGLIFKDPQNGRLTFPIGLKKSFTLECWIKPDVEHFGVGYRLFWASDYSIYTELRDKHISFSTRWLPAANNSEVKRMDWVIPLTGAGPTSINYYLDQQWHHMVFKYQHTTHQKEVWVDGKLVATHTPAEKITSNGSLCGQPTCKKNLFWGLNPNQARHYRGGLDEVVIYDSFVPTKLHYQHYLEGKANRPLTFTRFNQVKISQARELEPKQNFAVRDYPQGYPNKMPDPLAQLSSYPLPRYRSGHKLLPLFNWIPMIYLGGHQTTATNRAAAIEQATQIQAELAEHWHYYLTLQNISVFSDPKAAVNPKNHIGKIVALANQHPEWPLAVTSFWAQTNLKLLGEELKTPYILRNDLSADHYMVASQNAAKQNTSKKPIRKQVSPATPLTYFRKDGEALALTYQTLLKSLSRPIDIISENGEVKPYLYPVKDLEKDPKVMRDFRKSSLTDLDTYQAIRKTEIRKSYTQGFLSLPELKDTKFSWYAIDGGPIDRFQWEQAREIHRPIDGMYYSTPDFYPRWPKNWAKWSGAWRGWAWIDSCRKPEILAGDRLFSPFIGAGWSHDPTQNVRPSQWLGLLKHLNVVGAEFFYTGFFIVGYGKIVYPTPANYVWQAAMPSYAQAIASHYEPILREGNVLFDKQGKPIIAHPAGSPSILITARKHKDKPIYIIAGNINPISNVPGNVPDEAEGSITLPAGTFRFDLRLQGSVYQVDLTDPDQPVWVQLDKWHQLGHPSRWKADFFFDAEVCDQQAGFTTLTDRPGTDPHDFRDFTTYLCCTQSGRATYQIQPRNQGSYSLRMRLRSHKKRSIVRVYLDGGLIATLTPKGKGDWEEVALPSKSFSMDASSHRLQLVCEGNIDIDHFTVVSLKQ